MTNDPPLDRTEGHAPAAGTDPGDRTLEPARDARNDLERDLQPDRYLPHGPLGHGHRAVPGGPGNGLRHGFRVFALLVLPVVLLVGLGTFIRLVEADVEDAWLVVGMDRLRHAYLELAPELRPYFVTSPARRRARGASDFSFRTEVGVSHLLCGSPVIVGIIASVVAGVFSGIVCQALGGAVGLQIVVGLLVAMLAAVTMLAAMAYRRLGQLRRDYRPRFPEPGAGRGAASA